ncbi:hypothetical protein, partial [Mediterraneibacter gnavus]|uniref:hypothetical protein n=1 Tax=Mediterraneibacter gnavus TaxID=33038 RepID=UPI003566F17E
AIIIPENGAKVSKIKCFQFAQQTLIKNKGLTYELVDMLIEKIFIYPDKRVEIVLKIKNDLT